MTGNKQHAASEISSYIEHFIRLDDEKSKARNGCREREEMNVSVPGPYIKPGLSLFSLQVELTL